jgi:hypothetical protein
MTGDWELETLRAKHPAWTVTRRGDLIRAEREGFKTETVRSVAVMDAVLDNAEFAEVRAQVTGQ